MIWLRTDAPEFFADLGDVLRLFYGDVQIALAGDDRGKGAPADDLVFEHRFVERYGHLVEMRAFDELRRLVERDYETFSGLALERWFRERFIERGGLTRLGGWWDRRGENEIDIVAANETDRRATFCEVKRDASRISLPALREKAKAFLAAVPEWTNYRAEFKGLSLGDM